MLERVGVVGLGVLLVVLGLLDVEVTAGAIVVGLLLIAGGTLSGALELVRSLGRRNGNGR